MLDKPISERAFLYYAAAVSAAEFQYPGDWLADRNMYARRAQKIERKNSLDPMAPSRCRGPAF